MSDTKAPELLETRWRRRLDDAKLHLDFAQGYMREIQDEMRDQLASPGLTVVCEQAVRARDLAHAEHERVLQIYRGLTLQGIIPDESDWLRRQAADACGREDLGS
jgi:hypothetical protein